MSSPLPGPNHFWIYCQEVQPPPDVPQLQAFATEAGDVTVDAMKALQLQIADAAVSTHTDCNILRNRHPPQSPVVTAETHLQAQFNTLVNNLIVPPWPPGNPRDDGSNWIQGWISDAQGIFDPRIQRQYRQPGRVLCPADIDENEVEVTRARN
ncbi:hypothetical protein BDN72DRAFT_893229 [Pluteus cervinus]|uniref:Uncharacterized protein n=1 Tax=Pluteus cervinus TaxID=181527 RepID=A0ACD3B8S9_9AGAR|nr:hypothetical protein BDN72DRAFT_893229 [Pluteus cervinus]